MNQGRGVLLASFLKLSTEEEILQEVEFIANNLNLTNKFIFLLEDKENPDIKFLTYNASLRYLLRTFCSGSISIN